jgi:hypothetical protein
MLHFVKMYQTVHTSLGTELLFFNFSYYQYFLLHVMYKNTELKL